MNLQHEIESRNTLWNDEEGRLFMIRFCLDLLWSLGKRCRILEIGVDRGSVPIFLTPFFRWKDNRFAGSEYRGFYMGVDPKWRIPFDLDELSDFAKFIWTDSERFWQMDHGEFWDLIYVDGCHNDDVAALDVREAVKRLEPNGILLVHDTRADGGPRRAFIKECLGNPAMTGFLDDYENVCRSGMAVGYRKGSVWD